MLTRELIAKRETKWRWPSETAVDGQKVYVCDHEANCIYVNRSLNALTPKLPLQRKLSDPCGICISGSLIFVSEWGENCVSVFDKDIARQLATLGVGQLYYPSRMAVDLDGFVYVCDTRNCRVQVF